MIENGDMEGDAGKEFVEDLQARCCTFLFSLALLSPLWFRGVFPCSCVHSSRVRSVACLRPSLVFVVSFARSQLSN